MPFFGASCPQLIEEQLNMNRFFCLVFALMVGTWCFAAFGEGQPAAIGSITKVEGPVSVVRGDGEIAAEKGARLFPSDVIRTGEGGSIGMVLRDDTTLSLGPSSELKMSEFEFKPAEGIFGLTLGVAKGTLVYISGQIAKLAPGSARIETPAGVAAVRGTKLLVEVPGSETAKQKKG